MSEYTREENEIWLLRYIDERCEGTDPSFNVTFATVWWQKSEELELDAKLVVKRMDWDTLDATISRLEAKGYAEYTSHGASGYTVSITHEGRDVLLEVDHPDYIAAYFDMVRRDPLRARVVLCHMILSPLIGYVALAVSLYNLLRM